MLDKACQFITISKIKFNAIFRIVFDFNAFFIKVTSFGFFLS